MANFYKGSEIKFKVELTAEGFSMDDNDFDIEVASPRGSVKGSKTGTATTNQGSVALALNKEGDDWFAVADTNDLTKGELRVIATAHIPDTSASDGVRNEIDVQVLGTLLTP